MTQKIAFAKAGDRLSARYLNRIVDAANLAIVALGPPRSTRLPGTGTTPVELDAAGDPIATDPLGGLGTEVLTEISNITSTVRVEDPNNADIYLDVERYDQVTFQSTDRIQTLIFDR